MKYLVIVESPAKKIKIAQFLNTIPGHDFIVDASYGHVRYFKNGLKSIDFNNNYNPTYEIMNKSRNVISNLNKLKKKVDEVIIATDLDREGEAIGYHLIKSLKIDVYTTKRIVFNEITKNAIVDSFHNQETLDMDLFYAQQARSILDLILGFKISPIIWKNIAYKLSAGRCQSPALKIIYDRELDIDDFKSEKSYKIESKFDEFNNIYFKYFKNIIDREKIIKLLPVISNLNYYVDNIKTSQSIQKPPPPYITSTIQQDASCNLNLSPKQTMISLQKLYEKGLITYMRTDSVNISKEFQKTIKKYCDNKYKGFYKKNIYSNKKNTQEAHECIRPTKIDYVHNSSNEKENKLYNMIKKKIIASQMKNCVVMNYNYSILDNETKKHKFKTSIPKILDIGFKIIYDNKNDNNLETIKKIKKNMFLKNTIIDAIENNSKPPPRYTEASLIKELVKLGIGRPSTFSNIVNKNFERKYIEKLNNTLINNIEIFEIKPKKELQNKIKPVKTIIKNKIGITNLGKTVIEFLIENFKELISYDYTSKIEEDLDKIADNKKEWYKVVDNVNKKIDSEIKNVTNLDKKMNVSKKIKLGFNPKNKKKIYHFQSKKGNYIVQEGEDNDEPKFRFTSKKKIDLNEALDLFKFPRVLGKLNKKDVEINFGRFGYYISHGKRNMSIKSDNMSFDEATKLLNKTYYKEYSDFIVLEGKYGIYIKKGKRNIPIPKDMKDKVKSLKKKDFEKIISEYKGRKYFKKK
jgi:DNA topoisomerase I